MIIMHEWAGPVQSRGIAETADAIKHGVAFFDLVLVDRLEDVRCTDENRRRTDHRHRQKDVQLQTIDNHRDVAPVFEHLRMHRAVLYTHRRLQQYKQA